MEITQAQVGNVIYPLTEGQPLPVAVRDTIKVFYAFNYKLAETAGVKIWASLYNYSPGWLDRKEQAQRKETIALEKASEWKPYEGEIDIVIGQIGSGTYGLICELPDYEDVEGNPIEDKIDDCLEVAAPPSVFDMIGPLLMIGLMVGLVAMISPMMKEGF